MAEDYYNHGGSKVADFFLGLAGNVGFLWVYFLVAAALRSFTGALIVGFLIEFAVITRFIARGRRYIAIGMCVVLLPPLLFFGACFLQIMP